MTTATLDPNVQEMKMLFVSLGWNESYVNRMIRHIPATYGKEEYIKEKVESWFPISETDPPFEELFQQCGLNERTIKELLEVITPLYDTCYSSFHLYDIAMEYLFQKQGYDLRFSSHKNFAKGIQLHDGFTA